MISKYNRNGLITIGIPTEDILPLSSPWNDANNSHFLNITIMRFFFEIDRRMALHVSQLLNRPAAEKNLDTVSTVQCPLGNT